MKPFGKKSMHLMSIFLTLKHSHTDTDTHTHTHTHKHTQTHTNTHILLFGQGGEGQCLVSTVTELRGGHRDSHRSSASLCDELEEEDSPSPETVCG